MRENNGSNEHWAEVPEYEKLYMVSSSGRVVSLVGRRDSGAKMLRVHATAYPSVALWKNGQQTSFPIHRLMALAFIDCEYINKGLVCDHVDRNKSNNNLYNLRVVTQRENAHNTTRTLPLGVSVSGKKWRARIFINGTRRHLGAWDSPGLAHDKFMDALTNYEEIH